MAIRLIQLVGQSLGTTCKMSKQKMPEERRKYSRFTERSKEIMKETPSLRKNLFSGWYFSLVTSSNEA